MHAPDVICIKENGKVKFNSYQGDVCFDTLRINQITTTSSKRFHRCFVGPGVQDLHPAEYFRRLFPRVSESPVSSALQQVRKRRLELVSSSATRLSRIF